MSMAGEPTNPRPRYDWSARARSTAFDARRYTKFVTRMKRVLSLSAFAVIFTVLAFFFVARAPRQTQISYEKMGTLENDLAMVSPRLSGVDAEGNPFVITAKMAVQDAKNPKRATLDTMDKLSRHRGHFYNWYDTQTLHALPPHYVSTVDSGNLMGCLLVLACALERMDERPLVPRALARGIADTAHVIGDCVRAGVVAQPHAMLALNATLAALETLIEHAQVNANALPVLRGLLARIEAESARAEISGSTSSRPPITSSMASSASMS